jgi:hypothetical protein
MAATRALDEVKEMEIASPTFPFSSMLLDWYDT